jgi:4-hydroxybutyrate dehydrogenase
MSLITYLTRIHFADRVVEDALGVELRALGVRRAAVVTDSSGEAEDHYDRVIDALPPEIGYVPLRRQTAADTAALTALRRNFQEQYCDAVIGLGGPVALDLARALGQASTGRNGRGGGSPPVIALPTTTSSVGIGPLAGALGGREGMIPTVILCDPTLTMAQTPDETIAAGMDALTHCVEAWLGTAWNPPADGMALDGARRARTWLPRIEADGSDLEARRELLAAALNAGLASQKGLGAAHALAHALEAEDGLSLRHGWWHSALLPPAISFNAPAVFGRFAPLAAALGAPGGDDVAAAVTQLGIRIGLPCQIGELGLDRKAMARVAARAVEDPANLTNPRHAVAEDYLRMLEAAM